MGNYFLATTSPVDENNTYINKGAINGGFFKKGDYGIITHIVISVDNLYDRMIIVNKAGGKIMGKG